MGGCGGSRGGSRGTRECTGKVNVRWAEAGRDERRRIAEGMGGKARAVGEGVTDRQTERRLSYRYHESYLSARERQEYIVHLNRLCVHRNHEPNTHSS